VLICEHLQLCERNFSFILYRTESSDGKDDGKQLRTI